ncbi:MAG: hypothetical protein V3V97_12695, partial [Hyphomicrobiaceae bacterium]
RVKLVLAEFCLLLIARRLIEDDAVVIKHLRVWARQPGAVARATQAELRQATIKSVSDSGVLEANLEVSYGSEDGMQIHLTH